MSTLLYFRVATTVLSERLVFDVEFWGRVGDLREEICDGSSCNDAEEHEH